MKTIKRTVTLAALVVITILALMAMNQEKAPYQKDLREWTKCLCPIYNIDLDTVYVVELCGWEYTHIKEGEKTRFDYSLFKGYDEVRDEHLSFEGAKKPMALVYTEANGYRGATYSLIREVGAYDTWTFWCQGEILEHYVLH